MTDELQTTDAQLPALSDLAVEVFGDEFHGISQSERVEGEQFSARMRGYQALAQEKAQEVDAGVNRLESAGDDDSKTSLQWSNEDLRVLHTFAGEVQRFQADYQQAIKEFDGVDINELERTDRARAVQIRTDVRERAQGLRQRYTELLQVQQQLQQALDLRELWSVRQTEMKKMTQAEPQLADPATRKQVEEYLLRQGFTKEEIGSALDHRAVILAYRAMQAEKNPQSRKVPVFKRRPQSQFQTDEVSRAREKLNRTGSIDDALNLLTARREAAHV